MRPRDNQFDTARSFLFFANLLLSWSQKSAHCVRAKSRSSRYLSASPGAPQLRKVIAILYSAGEGWLVLTCTPKFASSCWKRLSRVTFSTLRS
ncbi:hypothetical protein F5Y16DRAFT_266714 [Xylariaceae sp. FL0255]|nr:hypothetical protein F5Y16DRAFT_266714 [Xylariaceae sp. FL0255]